MKHFFVLIGCVVLFCACNRHRDKESPTVILHWKNPTHQLGCGDTLVLEIQASDNANIESVSVRILDTDQRSYLGSASVEGSGPSYYNLFYFPLTHPLAEDTNQYVEVIVSDGTNESKTFESFHFSPCPLQLRSTVVINGNELDSLGQDWNWHSFSVLPTPFEQLLPLSRSSQFALFNNSANYMSYVYSNGLNYQNFYPLGNSTGVQDCCVDSEKKGIWYIHDNLYLTHLNEHGQNIKQWTVTWAKWIDILDNRVAVVTQEPGQNNKLTFYQQSTGALLHSETLSGTCLGLWAQPVRNQVILLMEQAGNQTFYLMDTDEYLQINFDGMLNYQSLNSTSNEGLVGDFGFILSNSTGTQWWNNFGQLEGSNQNTIRSMNYQPLTHQLWSIGNGGILVSSLDGLISTAMTLPCSNPTSLALLFSK
jgi:hypothetical protein